MGLFSNPCVNPECDARVRKGSQFCPKCGTSAPRSLGACGACGTEVAGTSKFCWKCGSNLADVAKPIVLGEKWIRRPGDLAVRFDDQDIKGTLTKPLIVEHGTRAIVFQAGKYKGEIREGRYDVGGFLKQLNNFMIDLSASVVLVDAADVTIDLENAGLWTADKMEVATAERLVLRIAEPEAMFVNLFKGRNQISVDEIECQLADEVQMLLSGIVAQHKAEQLSTDINVRNEIETQLRQTLAETLERLGLDLAQVRFVSFSGETYDQLRAKQGEVEMASHRAQLSQRLRETLTTDKMDSIKSEKDLEGFIRQQEQELGLKGVIRDDEMQRLTSRFAFERSHEDVLRRIEIEEITDTAQREKAWKDLLADEQQRDERHRNDLERRLKDTQSEADRRKIQLEVERLEHEQDMREQEENMRLLKQVKDMEYEEALREQELEAQKLRDRSEATAEALLSIMDGPAADRIVDLEKLRAKEKMTPEQILAMAAQASPEAAQALAAKYQAEGSLSEERVTQLENHMEQQRKQAEASADRMERVMHTAMQQMGHVAGVRAQPPAPGQTVIAPGMGTPVVVPSAAAQPPAGACKHCNAALEPGGAFCPQCGKGQ